MAGLVEAEVGLQVMEPIADPKWKTKRIVPYFGG
jgi:hypothetical protein